MTAPRRPKKPPRGPEDGWRGPHVGSRNVQDSPREVTRIGIPNPPPNEDPRNRQQAPKKLLRGLKRPPRGATEAPRGHPRRHKRPYPLTSSNFKRLVVGMA
eukprot:46706-Pyramimonas_sp.AAC.1